MDLVDRRSCVSNLGAEVMTQASFMDQFRRDVTILPEDTHVTEPTEVRRLASQNARFLERLRKGPATNVELAKIALKYTSRISSLRTAGYVIECKRFPKGLSVYTLKG